MKQVLHKAHSRGHANHGWLDSHHTFSFANYYNQERMNFGVLRVLNDDVVAPGMGFGTHPHDNMEIISVPLEGALAHKDSMGNTHVIRKNDIQVMSAGTGIMHSEYNQSREEEVRFLQIWVFPNQQNVTPRYDQQTFDPADRVNKWQTIVSPFPDESGTWIHQNAWFHLGSFQEGHETGYTLQLKENGVYIFVLSGSLSVAGTTLDTRDGLGITGVGEFSLKALVDTEVLLMEVPMSL